MKEHFLINKKIVPLLMIIFCATPSIASADSSTISVSVTDGEAFSETTIVYTAGGTASLTNDDAQEVSATIPADSYTENFRFQMTSYANTFFSSSQPAPSGQSFIGKTYDFTVRKTDGTVVSDAISESITIVLPYSASDISGYTESSLAPYKWNTSASAWDAISGYTQDTDANTVTFSTDTFSTYAVFGTATVTATPETPSSGGGGGGVVAPPTEVFFYGLAYPDTTVLLLKNAQIVASSRAKTDASFQFSLTGISAGTHTFGIVAEDVKGHRSITQSFTVKVTGNAITTLSGITLPPIVIADKEEVRKGDFVKIEGKALPGAEVALYLGDKDEKIRKILSRVSVGASGAYSYSLATASLAQGGYAVLARAEKGETKTGYSQEAVFTVGLQNKVAAVFAKAPAHVDFNKDNKVNLVDFSIAAFWFKQPSPPENVDTNKDGTVDLKDFSILAYFWTG
ncbi:MAG: hypothetical protein HYS73_00930 [Parcubacteria group bacterium]|nr:hypothetical protein [Parcubacteria group bacterium]